MVVAFEAHTQTRYYGVSWNWRSQNSIRHYTKENRMFWGFYFFFFFSFKALVFSSYLLFDYGPHFLTLSQQPSLPTTVHNGNPGTVCFLQHFQRHDEASALRFHLFYVSSLLTAGSTSPLFSQHTAYDKDLNFLPQCQAQNISTFSQTSLPPCFQQFHGSSPLSCTHNLSHLCHLNRGTWQALLIHIWWCTTVCKYK